MTSNDFAKILVILGTYLLAPHLLPNWALGRLARLAGSLNNTIEALSERIRNPDPELYAYGFVLMFPGFLISLGVYLSGLLALPWALGWAWVIPFPHSSWLTRWLLGWATLLVLSVALVVYYVAASPRFRWRDALFYLAVPILIACFIPFTPMAWIVVGYSMLQSAAVRIARAILLGQLWIAGWATTQEPQRLIGLLGLLLIVAAALIASGPF